MTAFFRKLIPLNILLSVVFKIEMPVVEFCERQCTQ